MAIDHLKPAFPLQGRSGGAGTSPLSGLKGLSTEKAQEAALRRASEEFESLFIYEMLKAMRKTIPEDGLFQGITGKETYATIMDQQLASALAERGGLGLAETIYRQIRPELQGVRRQEQGFSPPLEEGVVSSPFGMRLHPILGHPAHHSGVDIAAPEGSDILATADGTVIYSGWLPNYGNTVMVEHAGGYVSLYAHNETNIVGVDQRVERGQAIAQVGSTGRSTGPHLHFEIRLLGSPVDPGTILVAGSDATSKSG